MEMVSLRPLSRAEIRGEKPGFLKAAFDSRLGKPAELMVGKDLVQAVATRATPNCCGAKIQSDARHGRGTT
jgi:hypothetical protein